MTMPFAPAVIRPLPRPVKPFPQETEESFLKRLAAANAWPVQRLRQPSLWMTSRLDRLDQLSILSGQTRTAIERAIPDWQPEKWYRPQGPFAMARRWACRRCVARRIGTTDEVMVWASKHHAQVCVPHHLWIGRAVQGPNHQMDLSDLPEVVAAQRRHHRLLQRHGPHLLGTCYQRSSEFWTTLLLQGHRISDLSDRIVRLAPRASRNVRPWEPNRYASIYPEIITTAALYASPHWRQLAASNDADDFWSFVAELQRQLPQATPLRKSRKAWIFQRIRFIALTAQAQHDTPNHQTTPKA